MYENGQPVNSMKVVVGKLETPTPLISSMIHYATLNPYWNVPDNLVRKIVAAGYLKGGEKYLRASRLRGPVRLGTKPKHHSRRPRSTGRPSPIWRKGDPRPRASGPDQRDGQR